MIKTLFVLLFSEYLSGLIAVATVLLLMGFIPGSAYNFSFGPAFLLMKQLPEEILFLPIVFAVVKVLSGYYVLLFFFIKLTKKKYDSLEVTDILKVSMIAIFTIFLIMVILPIREGQSVEGWLKGILKMSEWFFNPKRAWSFLVYSGFIASLLSPLIYKSIMKKYF